MLHCALLGYPFPSFTEMPETVQSISSSLPPLPYMCFYGSCKWPIEMNGNTFAATVNALNMHYLGAESDIINRSLRTCQSIGIIALAKAVYVFSAVCGKKNKHAAKSVFVKFVFGLNSPESGIIHWCLAVHSAAAQVESCEPTWKDSSF